MNVILMQTKELLTNFHHLSAYFRGSISRNKLRQNVHKKLVKLLHDILLFKNISI